jgi:hypothetical protein
MRSEIQPGLMRAKKRDIQIHNLTAKKTLIERESFLIHKPPDYCYMLVNRIGLNEKM